MTYQEFLQTIGWKGTTFWGVLVFAVSLIIEFSKWFKWHPWTAIINWIGEKFNNKIDTKMDAVRGEIKALDKKIGLVQDELSKHINESETKSLQDTRRDILEFCNACMNGRKHTKEQFDFVIKQCDEYEKYIKKNDIKNGVIEASIKEIRRLYEICIQKNSFLKEGEEP